MSAPGLLLAAAVAVALLACAGMLLARATADRLHFLSAGSLAPPLLVGLAITLDAGLSAATIQTWVAVALVVSQSAPSAHVLGRLAWLWRGNGSANGEEG